MELIKKYFIDLICIILLAISFPLFVVGRPGTNYNVEVSKVETLEVVKQEETPMSGINNKRNYSNIEERNIFSPDGSYKTIEEGKKMKKKLDYEAYRFIGVIISGQKRAVFITESGKLVALKTGDMLEDGSVISSIENLSVKLKINNEVVEHRIFMLENEMN